MAYNNLCSLTGNLYSVFSPTPAPPRGGCQGGRGTCPRRAFVVYSLEVETLACPKHERSLAHTFELFETNDFVFQ